MLYSIKKPLNVSPFGVTLNSIFFPFAGWRKAPNGQGSLAITLISNWNPYSHVTPIPVSVG